MTAIDTNILVYAYDDSLPHKRTQARQLLESIESGVTLWQVACEFLSVSRKKASARSVPMAEFSELNRIIQRFPLVLPNEGVLKTAKVRVAMHQIQFWDALIYAACLEAGIPTLYSEDVPAARIAGLEVRNPFVAG